MIEVGSEGSEESNDAGEEEGCDSGIRPGDQLLLANSFRGGGTDETPDDDESG